MIAIILLFFFFAVVSITISLRKERERKERQRRLSQKYGPKIAEKIINKTIWVGETNEQLTESLGSPVDIDERVLKNHRREVWKYYQKAKNRFGLRITVENGTVIGWDEKL